jgi:uncharacterized protein (DUF433 family)
MQTIIPSKTTSNNRHEIGRHLVSDPEICHGKLTFAGTRILVRIVLAYLASGKSVNWVLSEWSQLPEETVTGSNDFN